MAFCLVGLGECFVIAAVSGACASTAIAGGRYCCFSFGAVASLWRAERLILDFLEWRYWVLNAERI